MRKLLWVGDAVSQSGFEKITRYVLDRLRKSWDVSVIGINYFGDPHPWPYDIYPAAPSVARGYDLFGLRRTKELVPMLKPDVIVLLNDPWNIPEYLKRIPEGIPVVGSIAIDGKNIRGEWLNDLSHSIFWTQFGAAEAKAGGYTKPSTVIPLGVDLNIYQTVDKMEARDALGMSSKLLDKFIVGNVNRNQPRKRLDLTIEAFAYWVKTYDVRDAYLFLHLAPTGDLAWDCYQLMNYYGLEDRLIIAEPNVVRGARESHVVNTYNSFDVQMTTTQGEGWGLTTAEGMACGVPQIIPNWSALGEWARPAAFTVDCAHTSCTPNGINVIGGVASRTQLVQALQELYRFPTQREELSARGLQLVQQERYRWSNIAKQYEEVLDRVLAEQTKASLLNQLETV